MKRIALILTLIAVMPLNSSNEQELGASSSSSGSQQEESDSKIIAAHIQAMRAIKEYAKKAKAGDAQASSSASSQSQASPHISQTDSYVQLIAHGKLPDVASIPVELVHQIIGRERAMADTHYVFYNAQAPEIIPLQDILKETTNWLHIRSVAQGFELVRTPERKHDIEEELYAFMTKIFIKHGGNNFDAIPGIREIVLSTNLSLFGNSLEPRLTGSSTFYDYFANATSGRSNIDVKNLLDSFAKQFNFNEKFIADLTAIAQQEASETKNGELLQIFIPKNLVDKVAWLSIKGGGFTSETDVTPGVPGKAVVPIMTGETFEEFLEAKNALKEETTSLEASQPSDDGPPSIEKIRERIQQQRAGIEKAEKAVESYTENIRKKHGIQGQEPWLMMQKSKISHLLELYQKRPQELLDRLDILRTIQQQTNPAEAAAHPLDPRHVFDELQARLLITTKTLFNPEYGIKIYRYTTIPEGIKQKYDEQIKKVVKEMMPDWIKQRITKVSVDADLESNTEAEKLIQQIKQHPR